MDGTWIVQQQMNSCYLFVEDVSWTSV